jgi:anti-anti-sigma factor
MQIKFLGDDDIVVRCKTVGNISQSVLNQNRDPLADMLGEDVYRRKVLLSLEDSDFIDSAGVGWLIRMHKRFSEQGGRLVLHSLTPMVAQTLRVLNLHKVFCLADGPEQARELAVSQACSTKTTPGDAS